MKDRLITCEYYICENADCKKGRKNVSMKEICKNCSKYVPRKFGNAKKESIRARKDKQINREIRKTLRDEDF